ncbi:hypothetical protein [Georgenia sp. Z1491]|uniref:hypothetical protein n=1 Tax=Georgenia sp. Z1491 TaxID=3416707 RepID=UPI003CF6E8FA
MWIVDPVEPVGADDDPEDTTRRSARLEQDDLRETHAWSPDQGRSFVGTSSSAAFGMQAAAGHPTASPPHAPSAPSGPPMASPPSAPSGPPMASPPHAPSAPFSPSAPHAAAPYGPSPPAPPAHPAAPYEPSPYAPSGHSATPPTATSSPPPAPERRGPWYTRAAPAAVAASTCVALVAVAIWAFVLREPAAREEDGPGKFDVEPPPEPGGDQAGGGHADGQPTDPSDLPDETGTDDAGTLAGLRPEDTFPRGQDQSAHTGPDGVPTNTEPLAMLGELELENATPFGRSSVMPWTFDDTGERIDAQLVGPTDWDATDEVMAHEAGNPPPPDGHVYVTQRVRVTAETADPFVPFASLLVYWTTRSGDVYGATSAVAPDDLFHAEAISGGESVEGNLVLCLPERVVEDGNWIIALNHSSNGYVLTP